TIALELGPDAGEGEQRPVIIEREPDDVLLAGVRVRLRRPRGPETAASPSSFCNREDWPAPCRRSSRQPGSTEHLPRYALGSVRSDPQTRWHRGDLGAHLRPSVVLTRGGRSAASGSTCHADCRRKRRHEADMTDQIIRERLHTDARWPSGYRQQAVQTSL